MKSTWKGLTVGVWLLAALGATVSAELDSRLDEHWELWKKIHQRKYQNEVEELGRRVLWEKNLMEISIHNLGVSLGLHTYTMGMNHLSDLTEAEMLKMVSPLKMPEGFLMAPTPLNVTGVEIPLSVDWRTKGYVTSVKNQGSCGSCYTFSSVGALEALWAKTTGELVDLSPQNLVDCSETNGNAGCGGGWMHNAFQYVIDNGGIDSEASYPYVGTVGECRYNSSHQAANCSSYHFVPKDEVSLRDAVATIGPVSVAIDASSLSRYSSGVFYNKNCGQQLSHAVLAVGYGTDSASGLDYWLIKNSWGTGWGENGYFKLARNQNQMCGISTYSVYPQ